MDQLMNNTVNDIDSVKIGDFSTQLKGKIVMASDETYAETRKVFNAMSDRRPGMFAMCTNVGDVIASVNFARENNLMVAIRGWGNNGGGLGQCEGGVVNI